MVGVVTIGLASIFDSTAFPHDTVWSGSAPDSATGHPNVTSADVLVLGNRNLESPAEDSMFLAVEVLSPSSRRKDAVYKRSKYEDSGVTSYWIVDPAAPSITALELVDGQYVTVGEATGDETVALEKPFPVTIVPSKLIA